MEVSKCLVKVKGIVKYRDQYLLVKRWYDDRVPDPFQWEFIDGYVEYKESPDDAVRRSVLQDTGIDAGISDVLYTWSYMIGDTHCIGIAYLLEVFEDEVILSENLGDYEWAYKEDFKKFIESKAVLSDLAKVDF